MLTYVYLIVEGCALVPPRQFIRTSGSSWAFPGAVFGGLGGILGCLEGLLARLGGVLGRLGASGGQDRPRAARIRVLRPQETYHGLMLKGFWDDFYMNS